MTNDNIYEKEVTSSYSNIGPFEQLKITSVFNLLQDAGAEHAERLHISGFDLAEKDLFWVISRYRIKINRNPRLNETLRITTWRSALNNLYDLRWFNIKNKNGEAIIEAVGAWVMVNKNRGRPCRLSRFFPETLLSGKSNNTIDDHFPRLRPPGPADIQHRFKIRMHDLDLNRHVNNAVYIEWAVETVPESMLAEYAPEKIDVNFLKESFYADNIVSKTEIDRRGKSPLTYHAITKKDTGAELARLNIVWRPVRTL